MSALLQANIERASTNYDGAVSKFKSYADVSDMVAKRQTALARQWGARLIENANTNVGAAFEAADRLAKSKTVEDVAQVHTDFLQANEARS